MKTDSIFFRIFHAHPGLLFELLGRSPDLAQGYEFRSVEIKQVAFRLDGVFLPKPDALDQTVWFTEIQFQRDPTFYQRFFAEIYLYLDLHPQTVDWQAVVIFPARSIEPTNQNLYRANLNSDQVHRVYLEDLRDASTASVGIGLMQLIVADPIDAIPKAKALLAKTQPLAKTDAKFTAIIELIETIVIYKFPSLSREAIESMLGLSELKQTKVYQEALEEGIAEGEQRGRMMGRTEGKLEGEQSVVLRQLARRIGNVPSDQQAQIRSLSLYQLEALAEALLDFSQLSDLTAWLN
ncbi:MAG: Rpn family recombination-promoting nuclease/putative transposase [Aphanocapsa sp. GSE-SYN-MK-11-07L]|nr:Rpn family recombination-promoting nuclease/putative transposase [Aphanocapsa sp. GSE-SYN-MK-11-07L]